MVKESTDELFICSCGDPEHQLIMRYWEDDNDAEVYCSVHLVQERNIFKRIWRGVKYIFGYTSIYGDFDEFIFKPHHYARLQTVVDYLKKQYDKEVKDESVL